MNTSNDQFDQIRALLAETVQLTRSNAVSIQSLTDRIAELTLVQEEAAEERRELREATERLSGVAEGIANLLSSLDEDRPTILRKLNTIENKVDRLLEREDGNGDRQKP